MCPMVDVEFKKAYTGQTLELRFNPCDSTSDIYRLLIPVISQLFQGVNVDDIEIVVSGQIGHGTPENAPALAINDTCFKNSGYWNGYNYVYSFYTRTKLTNDGDECAICYGPIVNINRRFSCSHGFCSSCISQWVDLHNHTSCPTCRSPISY